MTIAFASDHAGYEYKEKLISLYTEAGYEIRDFGTDSTESTDYPDYAHPMAQAVEKGDYEFGISLCGSGNGINMVANKYPGIRSALCWNVEIAELARLHNDANICALPARFISYEEAKEITMAFLKTGFEGGRHQRRVDKIAVSH